LSNVTYLPVVVSDAKIQCEIRPASVKFRVEDVLSRKTRLNSPGLSSRSTLRGVISEFSKGSRYRLQALCADLQALGVVPDILLTFTYPGEHHSVAPGGRAVKRHMKMLRERLTRYFDSLGVSFAALWFFEFQARGAPHVHLMIWGPDLRSLDMSKFRPWLANAWSEIIDHQDLIHRAKGLSAGTGAEFVRSKHFGYAMKYASKMKQKLVPADFQDVGRFWGLWNASRPAPVAYRFDMALEHLQDVVLKLSSGVRGYSSKFADRLIDLLCSFLDEHRPFSCTVFGVPAVDTWLNDTG
jgi:hypothetical protein